MFGSSRGAKILAQGSDSVYINGQPAARVGDRTVCDAKISAGSPNVCIEGGTATLMQLPRKFLFGLSVR
ncbi:PAAR domain-containing protein [Pseudomonas sp. TYF_15]|uniref:PAAR domain-containing protein n=1 Tax=Pseudomonas sp. TYF_15 TaxID=3367194 RepID=UPI00370A40C0